MGIVVLNRTFQKDLVDSLLNSAQDKFHERPTTEISRTFCVNLYEHKISAVVLYLTGPSCSRDYFSSMMILSAPSSSSTAAASSSSTTAASSSSRAAVAPLEKVSGNEFTRSLFTEELSLQTNQTYEMRIQHTLTSDR